MGILNITPDSFSDGGKFYSESEGSTFTKIGTFVEQALLAGVRLFDIGGESSRPGSHPISQEEESRRVIPTIKYLIKTFPNIILSVDTVRSQTATEALESGAHMINDISAGEHENDQMFQVAIKYNCPLILMHKQGTPLSMQQSPTYKNAPQEIKNYLLGRVKKFYHLGGKRHKLILDPGIGFGKLALHNLQILAKLSIYNHLPYPLLIGASNKKIIGEITGREIHSRLGGTIGLHLAACENGANIVRLHEPIPFLDALKCKNAVKYGKI